MLNVIWIFIEFLHFNFNFSSFCYVQSNSQRKNKTSKSARFKMDEVTRDSVVIGHFCDKQNYL